MSKHKEVLFEVQLRGNRSELYRNQQELVLKEGDRVIVEAERGLDIGTVGAVPAKQKCCQKKKKQDDIRNIRRLVTAKDLDKDKNNRSREEVAFNICREQIEKLKLDMKLAEVEHQFDGGKMIFYFTADHRVDFRQLVKNLASEFRTRIELRQIGVRDEAKRLSGVGMCGRVQCCSSFMSEFTQVTTQLARDQQLSLNPSKISGNCGRLLCCLQFEESAYEKAYEILPKSGSKFTPEGKDRKGDVVFVDIFKERIQVRTWAKGVNSFEWYTKEEIDKGHIDEPEPYYNKRR